MPLGVLLLGLCLWGVTGQPDDTRPVKCEIRVQGCANESDPLNVGFIEIGTKRLDSWSCVDSETQKRFKAAYVTGSCEYEKLMSDIATSTDDFNVVFDEITSLYQLVPYGGYFILVSAYAGFNYFLDVDSDGDKKYSTLLEDLHIEIDGGLVSHQDEQLQGGDDSGVIVISRKGFPDEGTAKVVTEDDAPRLVTFPVRATEKQFCIQPLTPLDSVFLDSRIYGQDIAYTQLLEDNQLEDISIFTNGLHVMTSEKIGCSEPVYGWEFIPANPTTVYFAVIRPGLDPDEGLDQGPFTPSIIGTTSVTITEDMITDDLEVQYKCLRPHPIIDVHAGDLFMFYTDDSSASEENTPLRRVYIPPHTNAKYPCSRQLVSFESGLVDVFDTDINGLGSPYSHEEQLSMNVALKPIMDPDFLLTCPCSDDSDCQEHDDPHMVCMDSQCRCNEGYLYNRATNLCLYSEAAVNGTAYQSSVLGDLTENEAGQAVDGDTRTDILTGTCAKTKAASDPWWLLDLGSEMEVYGVHMRTPEPLDVYLELWEDKADIEDNPDAVLYKQKYTDIQTDPGLSVVQAISVHGPMPWIIKTTDESDVKILNTALKDGETLYTFDNVDVTLNFGSVGENIGQIIRIEDFGTFQTTADTLCMFYKDPHIKTVSLAPGENCVEEVPDGGEVLIVYIEESSMGTEDFYIRNIKDHLAVALNSFTAGTKAVLGSDKTTFRFYLSNAARNAGTSTTVSGVLDGSAGVLIVPTNDDSVCLEESGGFMVVGSSCNTKFYLKEYFDDTLPEYTYMLVDWTGSTDDTAPYLEVDLLNSTLKPCYEIVRTTHQVDDVGAAVTYIDDSNNDVYIVVRDDDAVITSGNTEVLMRANVVGIHDFVVGVSSYFDGTTFDAANFTTCSEFAAAPVNGRLFRIDCKEPVMGRYVAIYMETSNSEEKIQLCDFNVLSLSGPESPIDDVCTNDTDCDFQGDDRKICDHDLHDEVNKGRCVCAEGFTYHRDSTLCVDIDECLNDPDVCEQGTEESGIQYGTCVNTVGSFHCDCPDGYSAEVFEAGFHCVDIDETQSENCGCEGSCENQYVDEGGKKYVCSCPDGYRLTLDEHGCVDINECEEDECDMLYSAYCAVNDCSATEGPTDCRNYPGTFRCICPRGFQYGLTGACTNIDECLDDGPSGIPNQGGCTSNCVDKNPKLDEGLLYECDCDGEEGYILSEDGHTCVDFDECIQSPCLYVYDPMDAVNLNTEFLESGMCMNTAGSFHCLCRQGYVWHPEINGCVDINECTENHECEDICENTDGDYDCDCDEGFELALNGHSCQDIDECADTDHHECDDMEIQDDMAAARCVNNVGSYSCHCPHGYEWTCHERHSCGFYACFDIDECERRTDFCQYECHNRYMRSAGVPFLCSCDEGWQLANDNRTCVDVDECDGPNICDRDALAHCVNSIGAFICRCSTGYEFDVDAENCADIDECAENNGGCANECHNTVGSFHCHCPPGYDIDPNGRACIDVNECANRPCEHTCFNNPGSFYCTCEHGFLPDPLDELRCIDVDECSLKNGGCMHNCTNNIGSFECSCMQGYSLMKDHVSCDVHDECFNPQDNDCAQLCINTFEGYECDCRHGYTLNEDHRTCGDLDECQLHNGGCEQKCFNTDGDFYCDCYEGFHVGLNHKQCHDVDECDTNNGHCDQICVNTPGSYLCLCDGGQKVGEDGHKCVGQNFIRMRTKIDLDWHPSYGNIDTPGFASLQASLEYNFMGICRGAVVGNSYGSVECRIVGPFTQGSVIFDLIVLTASPLSEGDRSVLSYAIKESLDAKDNYLVINGTSVPIQGKPQFIYTAPGGSGGSELVWTVDTLCTYYDETSYCLNGGNCEVDRGYPHCKCLEGYEGERCNKVTDEDLTTTEIALIASVSVLGLAMVFLLIVTCWMCFKHMGRVDSPPEQQQTGDEKLGYGGTFPYFTGSTYWPYGNYN